MRLAFPSFWLILVATLNPAYGAQSARETAQTFVQALVAGDELAAVQYVVQEDARFSDTLEGFLPHEPIFPSLWSVGDARIAQQNGFQVVRVELRYPEIEEALRLTGQPDETSSRHILDQYMRDELERRSKWIDVSLTKRNAAYRVITGAAERHFKTAMREAPKPRFAADNSQTIRQYARDLIDRFPERRDEVMRWQATTLGSISAAHGLEFEVSDVLHRPGSTYITYVVTVHNRGARAIERLELLLTIYNATDEIMQTDQLTIIAPVVLPGGLEQGASFRHKGIVKTYDPSALAHRVAVEIAQLRASDSRGSAAR